VSLARGARERRRALGQVSPTGRVVGTASSRWDTSPKGVRSAKQPRRADGLRVPSGKYLPSPTGKPNLPTLPKAHVPSGEPTPTLQRTTCSTCVAARKGQLLPTASQVACLRRRRRQGK
jgi:hypothetical protein